MINPISTDGRLRYKVVLRALRTEREEIIRSLVLSNYDNISRLALIKVANNLNIIACTFDHYATILETYKKQLPITRMKKFTPKSLTQYLEEENYDY